MQPTTLVVALALSTLLLAAPAAAQPADDPSAADAQALETGRRLTAEFYRGELETLVAGFSTEMRESMPVEQLAVMRRSLQETLGDEIEILDEQIRSQQGYSVYRRVAKFEKHDGEVEVLWALRVDGKVGGFFVRRALPELGEE